jgi:cytosine/adenosine deaminase-related metal-dependent hydrolase
MRFISATQLFSGEDFLDSDAVIVLNTDNSIEDLISSKDIDAAKIEHFEGIICPGFINTHCHLELSHLKNVIPQHTGIVDFGLNIIKNRNNIQEELQLDYMQQADTDMYQAGIVAVGDISNTKLSIQPKKKSSIFYHTFVELIGLNPERAASVFDAGRQTLTQYIIKDLACSLAPHAPYSTSPLLIELISQMCLQTGNPTSIHNQESKAENDFFNSKTGDYLRLYDRLKLSLDFFNPTNKSSLESTLPFFQPDLKTLLVHNTFSSQQDIDFANKLHPNLYWCLCPNANLYIENTLPDIEQLVKSNCTLTLGTDSLASNTSLSILDEINTIVKHKPSIPLKTLLNAATYNGAQFLGIDNKFGSFEKHKTPGLNLLQKKSARYTLTKIA